MDIVFVPSTADSQLLDMNSTKDVPLAVHLVQGVLMGILTLSIIVTNIICLIALRSMQEMNPVTRVFMTSMTLSDLGIGLLCCLPTTGAIFVRDWPYGDEFCTISSILNINCFFTSFMCLFSVTCERYFAVTHPFTYPVVVTVTKARVSVVILWTVSTTISLLCAILPGRTVYFYKPMHTCFTGPADEDKTDLLGSIAFILFVIVPFTTTLNMFFRLFLLARKHARRIAAQETIVQQTETRKTKSERKTFITFSIMTIVLSVGYTPLVVNIVYENLTRESLPTVFTNIAAVMAFSNSFSNGVIYYFRNSAFRRAAKKLIRNIIPFGTQEGFDTSSFASHTA